MSAATLTPPRKRFTRDEVEQMMAAGLFENQRFELINGDLIDKMGQNPPHAFVLFEFNDWLTGAFRNRVRPQLSMEVAAQDRQLNWPEPDLAVLAEGSHDFLRIRHPRGDELVLIIEVSDSTLRFDLTTKRDLYAHAGVPEYWVVDIPGRKIVVHRRPSQGRYAEVITLLETDTAALPGRPEHVRSVASLLP